jgi:hypothetical protein
MASNDAVMPLQPSCEVAWLGFVLCFRVICILNLTMSRKETNHETRFIHSSDYCCTSADGPVFDYRIG